MTLSAYVKPQLLGLAADLARVVPRLVAGDDGEAVHDLRVALRKLRSVLRTVRRLYGGFHTDAVRAGFKRVADATGALRDEEVLGETLSALELSPRAREALAAWLGGRRAGRERKLRRDVVALVGGGALDGPSAMLGALLTLPVDPGRDKPAARFARKVVFSALDEVERAQPVDAGDAAGLHELRILYKRLRYAVDAFAGVLPPEFEALERAAAAFQKRLGTVHDLDVALDVVEGAEGLPPEARAEALDALARERARQGEKYERERARGGAKGPDGDPGPKAARAAAGPKAARDDAAPKAARAAAAPKAARDAAGPKAARDAAGPKAARDDAAPKSRAKAARAAASTSPAKAARDAAPMSPAKARPADAPPRVAAGGKGGAAEGKASPARKSPTRGKAARARPLAKASPA